MTQRRHRRVMGVRRWWTLVVAVLLAAGGATAIGLGWAVQRHPPQPTVAAAAPPAVAGTGSVGSTNAAPARTADPPGPVLPRSVPIALNIPAIGVHHRLAVTGENPDGTVEVPPLSAVDTPSWDKFSPAPGQLGPAVILGHVDSATEGQGVFFDLGGLRMGDTVSVTRADHQIATFRVTAVEKYAKRDFPTLKVYGNTPTSQLRLITCGGTFDPAAHSYRDNLVAYATLINAHPG